MNAGMRSILRVPNMLVQRIRGTDNQSMAISLQMPSLAAEHVSFELSPMTEAAQSWHVLTTPGHHALQVPWVRQCRELPADLRGEMRHWSWVVREYVPALFEAGAGYLDRRYSEERQAVGELPLDQVSRDLVAAARHNQAGPYWIGRARDDPGQVLEEILQIVDAYWDAAFADEWTRLEPQLLDAVTAAGRAMPGGVLPMLAGLAPAVRLDVHRRTVVLDLPHDHEVVVADRSPLRLTPSFYAWPHVRVTCEKPWALRLTYPVVPPSPHARRTEPAQLLAGLRALAAGHRLEIVRLLGGEARSTQELAGLLGLSESAVSRHLKMLLDAGVLGVRREGYYVLYEVQHDRLIDLAHEIHQLGAPPPPEDARH
jgi:DNA-binding transcriptional ArsR family regulator